MLHNFQSLFFTRHSSNQNKAGRIRMPCLILTKEWKQRSLHIGSSVEVRRRLWLTQLNWTPVLLVEPSRLNSGTPRVPESPHYAFQRITWQLAISIVRRFCMSFPRKIFFGKINGKLLNMTEKRKYLGIDRSCDILLLCTSIQYFFLTNFAFLFSFPECGWPTLNWTINSAKEANNSGERGKSRNSTTQVGSTATAQTNIE